MKLIQRFAEHQGTSRLLHPSLRDDEVLKVRAKLYGLGAAMFFVLSTFVALPYFTQGQPGLGAMTLSFGMLGACSLIVIRFVGNMSLATHFLCLALWGATVSGYMVLGGVDSYTNKWLLLMPMLGVFSGQRATGWVWLAIAAMTPSVFHLLVQQGVLTPVSVFDEAQLMKMDLGNSLLFIVTVSLLVFIIHAHHVWVITQLEDRERVMSATNAELVLARDEAVRANHARDRFLANMSHELRTPLNAMLGYSEIIQDDLHDAGNVDHDPDFALIKRSGDNLLTMLHDILELTKFESAHVDLPTELVDLSQMVESLATRQDRAVSLQIDDSWHALLVDTHRATFESLLRKLLDNACKFARDDDLVGVVMHPRDAHEQTYRLEIFDEGPGISPEDQSRIWEPFAQADSSVTRERDGAGLGLSLVRHFAASLGVHVTLQSAPNDGTRVCIIIPEASVHPSSPPLSSQLST